MHLGFGLNCTPIIMMKIFKVVGRDERICKVTDHYADDITVREDGAVTEEVVGHLKHFGNKVER